MNTRVMLILCLVVSEGLTFRLEECNTATMMMTVDCQPWKNQQTINTYMKDYSGLLLDDKSLLKAQEQFASIREDIMNSENVKIDDDNDDGDTCCPTIYNYHKNTSLTNIYGKLRPIVHIPPNYQFIPHASCGDSGSCDGKCVIEPLPLSLLTYNYSTRQPEFDTFLLPGYCSCKNIKLFIPQWRPWSGGILVK